MTLRKIPVNNSLRYIAQSERTKGRDIKPNTKKNQKPDKTYSQINGEFVKDFAAKGFRKRK